MIFSPPLEFRLLEWIVHQWGSLPTTPPSSEIISKGIESELGGLIYDLTSRDHRAYLPYEKELQKQWLNNLSAHLARGKALARFWPRAISSPLLIKGADLELHLYPEWGLTPGARPSSDWDLLIPDPEYLEIHRLWSEEFGTPTMPRSARFRHEPPHEAGFYLEGLLFEVHRDPAPLAFTSLRGRDLWERSQERITPEKFTVRAPHSLDRLLIWLVHYAKAGGAVRLLMWIDLTVILLHLQREKTLEDQGLDQVLSALGLRAAWRDALQRWSASPLSALSNQSFVNHRPNHRVFMRRLTPESPRWRIAYTQLKMCDPRLRVGYASRVLARSLRG